MIRRVSQNPPHLAIQTALPLEGSMQANRNNEDAPEELHEIPDAKQSQARLVCQEGQPRFRRRSPPHRAGGMQRGRHPDNWHRPSVGLCH